MCSEVSKPHLINLAFFRIRNYLLFFFLNHGQRLMQMLFFKAFFLYNFASNLGLKIRFFLISPFAHLVTLEFAPRGGFAEVTHTPCNPRCCLPKVKILKLMFRFLIATKLEMVHRQFTASNSPQTVHYRSNKLYNNSPKEKFTANYSPHKKPKVNQVIHHLTPYSSISSKYTSKVMCSLGSFLLALANSYACVYCI
jgi:hypothetical protein